MNLFRTLKIDDHPKTAGSLSYQRDARIKSSEFLIFQKGRNNPLRFPHHNQIHNGLLSLLVPRQMGKKKPLGWGVFEFQPVTSIIWRIKGLLVISAHSLMKWDNLPPTPALASLGIFGRGWRSKKCAPPCCWSLLYDHFSFACCLLVLKLTLFWKPRKGLLFFKLCLICVSCRGWSQIISQVAVLEDEGGKVSGAGVHIKRKKKSHSSSI